MEVELILEDAALPLPKGSRGRIVTDDKNRSGQQGDVVLIEAELPDRGKETFSYSKRRFEKHWRRSDGG